MTGAAGNTGPGAVRVARFGAQNPTHPWWHVADRIVEQLVGYEHRLLPDVRWAVVTPRGLQRALELGITTPLVAARMALEGIGAYAQPHPGRAIAAYPHIDCVILAIRASTGISSFEEFAERRYPLRLVSGRRIAGGIDVLTFTVEEVLRQYDISYVVGAGGSGRSIHSFPAGIVEL